MYRGKRVLAVVPARGGSKGVPMKNIHPLNGRPLIAYTGDVVRAAGLFDRAVVSTDHAQIASVAAGCGLAAPFLRPEALSGDRVGDWDVLEHATREIERIDAVVYDVVVMLQPTSPLRTSGHVVSVIEELIDGDWDAVWTVSPTPLKYHPLKQLCVSPDGRLDLFDGRGRAIVARQQLEPTYYRNGVAYGFSRRALLELGTTLPERSAAVVVEGALSIDTLADFSEAERVLAARESKVRDRV